MILSIFVRQEIKKSGNEGIDKKHRCYFYSKGLGRLFK
jgi:hypothetical protein